MSLRLRVAIGVFAFALVVAGGAGSAAGGASPQAETPVSGGTLNVIAEQQVPLNPYENFYWTDVETAPVLEGAFQQGPDGTFRPQLVTSVDVTTSPSLTLTYHINPAAVWSDGQPVTATDFIFTWQTVMANPSFVGSTAGYSDISSMTSLDSKTVQVVFDTNVAYWRELFSPVLPEHALEGADFTTVWNTALDDPNTGKPIGDGPFLVTGSTPTQITLSRNPQWWGSHAPYLSSIVFHVVTDTNTEESEMANGQVQAIFPTTGSYLTPLLGNVASQSTPDAYLEHLVFNVSGSEQGPLEDQAWVRQAIAYSIDRSAIAGAVYAPLVSQAPAQSLVYYANQAGYASDFATYSYSTSQVATLMTNHGCSLGGDSIWVCSGHRMSFTVTYTQGNSVRLQEANTMQSEAHAAGIDLVPTPMSSSVIFGPSGIPGGHFQIGLYAEITSGDPSDWSGDYTCGASGNYSGYCSTAVDDAFDAVNTDTNDAQRVNDANQADSLLAQDVPALPLFSRPKFIFYSTTVRGLVDNAYIFGSGPLWNAQDIWLAPSVAAPDVTSFTPTHGTTGTNVTLTGTGFTGASGVSFGGTAVSSFIVHSDTQITATVAAGTSTGALTVTGPGGSATTSGLFYTPPTISGFTPASAATRATVTVSGTSFTGTTAVMVNGTSVPFTIASNTRITFTVPSGATDGTIQVTAPDGVATSAGTLTVISPPTVTSISPGTGPVGTPVTIIGTNLDHTVGVELGHILTVPTSVSATGVTFTIPPGAATGTITILATNGSATSGATFTVTG